MVPDESVEEIQTRVENNLTELSERFGELQSRVEAAAEELENYGTRVHESGYKDTNLIGLLVSNVEADLQNIEQEVDAVGSVLRDVEESGLDLEDALEENNG